MPRTLVTAFRKKKSCPSSQTLLGFSRLRLSCERDAQIEAHLASCDFCNAELQLLTHHRIDIEEYVFADMPVQLRRLAESLLQTSVAPSSDFAKFRAHYQG